MPFPDVKVSVCIVPLELTSPDAVIGPAIVICEPDIFIAVDSAVVFIASALPSYNTLKSISAPPSFILTKSSDVSLNLI